MTSDIIPNKNIKLKSSDSHFIQVDIEFATTYGVNEAIVAGKLSRLEGILAGRVDDAGIKWIRLTLEEWAKEIPFMKDMTIRRTIESLEEKNILLSRTFTGRPKWYRLNPDFVDSNVSVQNEQIPPIISVQNKQIEDVSVQNEQSICSNCTDVSVQNEQLPRILPISLSLSEEEEKADDSSLLFSESAFSEICKTWQSNIGFLSPIIADEIKDVLSEIQPDCQVEWFRLAIGRGCSANARTWRYIKAILLRWIASGGVDIKEIPQAKQDRPQEGGFSSPTPELPPPPELSPEEITLQKAKEILSQQMTKQTFDDLIRQVKTVPRLNGDFRVIAPTKQAKELIENRLIKPLSIALKSIDPTINEIKVMTL